MNCLVATKHTVNKYLSGNRENIPPPKFDIQLSWLTACSKCRKLYIADNNFCGHCGGEIISIFIQCPKCNKQNGANTPLCEHCDEELPSKFGLLPRCAYCGTENYPKPYYSECSQCKNFLKPLSRCFVCGKYDRESQQNDMHGCRHGIRVHWNSPPKS